MINRLVEAEYITEPYEDIYEPVTMNPFQTYNFWIHDSVENKIEIMQYTEKSYQLIGSIM